MNHKLNERLKDREIVYLVMALAGAVWVFYCINAVKTYNHDDIQRFMMARTIMSHPKNFLDMWGRPLYMVLYMLPAQINLTAARIFSTVLSLATMWLVYAYAARSGYVRPWLAPLFLAVMPRYLTMSYNVMDALPVCFLLALSMYLISLKRYNLSGLVISLTPLARPESVLFLAIFAAVYLYNGKWQAVLLSATGLFVWNAAGFLVTGDPIWLAHASTYNVPYGSGELMYYVKRLPEITDPVLLAPFLVGMVYGFSKLKKNDNALVIGVWSVFFAFYAITWWFGAFATVGLTRYFNTVLPLAALIMLKGVNYVLDEDRSRLDAWSGVTLVVLSVYIMVSNETPYTVQPLVAAVVLIMLRALVLSGLFGPMRIKYLLGFILLAVSIVAYAEASPMNKPDDEMTVMARAAKVVEEKYPDRYVLAWHPWFYYYADIDQFDKSRAAKLTEETVLSAPVGTIMVYENHYASGSRYGNLDANKLVANHALRVVHADVNQFWKFLIIEKTAEIKDARPGMFLWDKKKEEEGS